MEGFNPKPTDKREAKIDDGDLFGIFLHESKREDMRTRGPAEVIKELANKIGVSPGAITSWHSGLTFPKPEKLKKIADAYDIEHEEVKRVFLISQKAREKVKAARKPTKPKKEDFWERGGDNS